MEENMFSRCTYEVFQKGMPAPEKCTYILRCGCSPYDALDQVEEDFKYDAPDGCETRVTMRTVSRDDLGGRCLVPRSIEYIDEFGEVIFKIFNMTADSQQYTMEYLLDHPELLPGEDVDGFKAAYARFDAKRMEV